MDAPAKTLPPPLRLLERPRRAATPAPAPAPRDGWLQRLLRWR